MICVFRIRVLPGEAESDGGHLSCVSFELAQSPPRVQLPQSQRLVGTSGKHPAAIGAKR